MHPLTEIIENLNPEPIIAIGGFLTLRKPVRLIREIVKCSRKDLIILSLSGSFEIDLLIRSGCVKEVIAPYVGAESTAPVTPLYKKMCEEGSLISEPWDTAMLVQSLKAAVSGNEYAFWRPGIGTDIPGKNRRMNLTEDAVDGFPTIRIQAIKPELALIHASYADENGNACFTGPAWGDVLIANASEKVAISIEEIKNQNSQDSQSEFIPNEKIDLLELSPEGAKPFNCPGYYDSSPENISHL